MDEPTQPPSGSKSDDPASRGKPGGAADARTQRRLPPPDATGDEAAYLAKLRERRTPIAVEMLDGQVFHGIIEYYDRDMLKVNRLDSTGPNVFIRKKHVRLMWEETPANAT